MLSSRDNYSMEGYGDLLQLLKLRGFEASSFSDPSEGVSKVILRHDVDADLEAAVAMAEMERDSGIRGTYCLMLASPIYNLLSHEFASLARKIVSLGHYVGLHYDENYNKLLGMNSRDTELDIQVQAELVSKLLSCEVTAVSFHQPSPSILQYPPKTQPLTNAYGLIGKADTAYVSDSNRRAGFMEDVVSYTGEGPDRVKNLQILIHPMWWYYKEQDCAGVWDRVIESSISLGQNQLVRTERAFGARRKISINVPSAQDTGMSKW
jgi:hypothetical protein